MQKVEVYIPIKSSEKIGKMMDWAEEEEIGLLYTQPMHSESAFGRAIVYGFTFVFDNEEGATAFKLRWL